MPTIVANTKILSIGKQGEHNATRVEFPLSSYIDEYGEGTAQLTVQRPGEAEYYPAVVTREENNAVWMVSKEWTEIAGAGHCQLSWYVDGVLAKSDIYQTNLVPSMGVGTKAPDPQYGYLEQVQQAGVQAQDGAKRSEKAAKKAEDAATHPPVVGENGNWFQWNGTTYEDTGLPSRGEDGKGVVKYFFDPEIWRWVMKYTDDHINTYPGFSPHDRDKFVVWRDTFHPGRSNVHYGLGSDVIFESASGQAFYDIKDQHHGTGTQYGVAYMDGHYVAKLCAGAKYNRMVTKCHSWGSYSAQMDFYLQAPTEGNGVPGLTLNIFEGCDINGGPILAYIVAGLQVYITDNTPGGAGKIYMMDEWGERFAPDYDKWYTAKMTCDKGIMTLSIWARGLPEANAYKVECRSASITGDVIESQKGLRVQTRASGVANPVNTVFLANLLMWEDFAQTTKSEKYAHIESIAIKSVIDGVERIAEPDGTPYNFKRVRLMIYTPKADKVGRSQIEVHGQDDRFLCGVYNSPVNESEERYTQIVVDVSHGYIESQQCSFKNPYYGTSLTGMAFQEFRPLDSIKRLLILSGNFPQGTKIDIYGVRG